LKKINCFKRWLVAVLFVLALPAQAAVIMTDGTLETYNPNETYIPSGTLGPDIFSIGWVLTDPTHALTINLAIPNDLVGEMWWYVTGGIDATGMAFYGDVMEAGESASIPIGPGDLNTPQNPGTVWFSMAAPDMASPVSFGTGAGEDLISLSDPVGNGGDTGNGNGNGNGDNNPVPEPPILFLLAGGLLTMMGFTAERKRMKGA
jgi:hypothetical protein